ncbi:DUF7793 family protein [Leeia oryzae]|uniref:DUF7793 family protein n=1 Tax=Leeia oryzae TaxID=356662 RepID=UPI000373E88D|nr:hypothetical protein [Leeia oryzae]
MSLKLSTAASPVAITLRDDGIVCVDYGKNPLLSGAALMEIVQRRKALCPSPTPVLVRINGRPVMDGTLPAALRSPDYCQLTLAVAYVTDSWYVRKLLNTHLTIDAPPYPLFVFEHEDEAVTCLTRYLPGK